MELACIDHVAIGTKNVKATVAFYQSIGLTVKYEDHPDFGSDPAMLSCGQGNNSGLAICPAKRAGMKHFAFRVTEAAFGKAKAFLEEKKIKHRVEDHDLQLSMYFVDPVNSYEVEITTWPAAKSNHAAGAGGATGAKGLGPAANASETATTAFYTGAVVGICLTVLGIRLARAMMSGKRLI